MKKIAIRLSLFLLAIFIAAFIALHFIKSELTKVLHQQQIQFEQLQLSLLPKLSANLFQVHWQNPKTKIEAKEVSLHLDFQSLFNLQNSFKQLSFEQAKIWKIGQAEPEFNNINGELKGYIGFAQNEINFKDLWLNIRLDKKVLLNTQEINLAVQQGKIFSPNLNQYQVNLRELQINGESFLQLQSQIRLDPLQKITNVVTELHQHNSQTSHLTLDIFAKANKQQIHFNAKNLLIQQWSKIFNLPTLLSGATNSQGRLLVEDNKILLGDAKLSVFQGELQGLNILQLIEKYVPANLTNEMQNREINTKFERLDTEFAWDLEQLHLQKLYFQNSKIIVNGSGKVNLSRLQCDVALNVGVNNPNYQHLELPLKLWGDCSSPKYKVEFDRNFRQSLKELLRSKFR